MQNAHSIVGERLYFDSIYYNCIMHMSNVHCSTEGHIDIESVLFSTSINHHSLIGYKLIYAISMGINQIEIYSKHCIDTQSNKSPAIH